MFLMANLGSDVSQLFSHLERGEQLLAVSAAGRAQKIVVELLMHPELQGRTGEVEMLQSIIQDTLSGKRLFEVSKNELEAYFMPFALRVLRQSV